MTRELAVGIDVGTTSTKVAAVDRCGEVVAIRSAEHGLIGGTDAVEADPASWWRSVRSALRGLAGLRADVVVVGLCGNMSSAVLVDRCGAALRPAMLLADPRGADEIANLGEDVRAEIERTTGNSPGTVFTLAKLLWLARHEPLRMRRANAVLTAKDFIRHRLTGTLESEPTDSANTLLLDERGAAWRTDLIEALGLRRSLFPPLVDSESPVGAVTDAAAAATGLPAGIPVQAGTGDMAAALLGAHDPEPGSVLISLGTSVTTLACVREFASRWSGALTSHPLPAGMGSMALGSLITGGLAVNWLRSVAGDDAVRAADARPDPDRPLVFLPHLAGAGTPDFRPEARGSLFGLDTATTGADLAHALFEGTAFEIAEVLRLLGADHTERVLLAGGGTNLPAWVRIITDVLGRETEVLERPDTSTIGAARLAWRAVGTSCPAAGRRRRCAPRTEYRTAWQRREERYRDARRTAFRYYAAENDEQRP
ncbi:xylulokinase [Saccharopolyspora gloriosae]|uniref:xylulokinase n=1 Tax=Saccharopolyspora gloriosae TaxID=455344 RepID=UPI001FB73158|nr:FGGY family carbohydrate kinase [Saccharopolyspora gloriosae]